MHANSRARHDKQTSLHPENRKQNFEGKACSDEKTLPGQDEKLILLYCPGRGLNSRPPAHRSFKHGQGVPRP